MTLIRRTATFAALTIALTGPALSAHAAGTNSWKTLATVSGGKIQACKTPTTKTGPWKIKFRVDARNASGRVSGVATVLKNEKSTSDKWSSGYIDRGHVSSVGFVKLPRDSKYSISAGIGTGAMGNGGEFKAGDIRPC
jgi:hypothetical protein